MIHSTLLPWSCLRWNWVLERVGYQAVRHLRMDERRGNYLVEGTDCCVQGTALIERPRHRQPNYGTTVSATLCLLDFGLFT